MRDLSVADSHGGVGSEVDGASSPHGFPTGYSAEHYASANKLYGGAGADAGAPDWRSEIRERDATIAEQREAIQVHVG